MTAVANLKRGVRMLGISVHVSVLGSYFSAQRQSIKAPPAYKYILYQVAIYKNGLPHELVLTPPAKSYFII
jgi:hypothetical protein